MYFSPKGGCTDAINKEIQKAKSNILIQAYSFTSKPIADELVNAKKRNIQIVVIIDSTAIQSKYCIAPILIKQGIDVFSDSKHSIAHNKIIIIDENIVITGSFNFTNQAENGNAENLIIIRNTDIAKKYLDNWNMHKSHSKIWRP